MDLNSKQVGLQTRICAYPCSTVLFSVLQSCSLANFILNIIQTVICMQFLVLSVGGIISAATSIRSMTLLHSNPRSRFDNYRLLAYHSYNYRLLAYHSYNYRLLAYHSYRLLAYHSYRLLAYHSYRLLAYHSYRLLAYHSYNYNVQLVKLGKIKIITTRLFIYYH